MTGAQKEGRDRASGQNLAGTLKSVLGAAIGVQSGRKHQEDATHGKPARLVLAGVLFTLLFVTGVAIVVQLVLANVSG